MSCVLGWAGGLLRHWLSLSPSVCGVLSRWPGVMVCIGSALVGGAACSCVCLQLPWDCCSFCCWRLFFACVLCSALDLRRRCSSCTSFIVVALFSAWLLVLQGGRSAGSISTSCGSLSPSSSLICISGIAAPWLGVISAVAAVSGGGLAGLTSAGVLLLGCLSCCSLIWKGMVGVSCSWVVWGCLSPWFLCGSGAAGALCSIGNARRSGRSSVVGGMLVWLLLGGLG